MAFMVIELDIPADSVTELNGMLKDASLQREGIELLLKKIKAIKAGTASANVAVAVRSTTSTPAASGGGNTVTYNKK